MALEDRTPKERYGIVLGVVFVALAAISWYVARRPPSDWYVFLLAAGALFVAGVEWDRIFLHERTV